MVLERMLLFRTILLLLFQFFAVVSHATETKDAKQYFRLGMEGYGQGNYLDALENFSKAFSRQDVKHPSPESEKCPYYMGCIAQIYNDDVYATRFYMLALDVCNRDSLEFRCKILSNLITVQGQSGTVEKASAYYKEYMKLKERLHTAEDSCMMLSNQAYLELCANKYRGALEFLKAERLYVGSQPNASQIEASMETDFAYTYMMLGEVDSALMCLKRCERLLKEGVHAPFIELRLYKLMSNVYHALGNEQLSMQYMKRRYELEDSVFNEKEYTAVMSRVVPMVENAFQSVLLQRQRMHIIHLAAMGGGCVLLLVIITLYFYVSRRRKRKKAKMAATDVETMPVEQVEEESEQEKEESLPTKEEVTEDVSEDEAGGEAEVAQETEETQETEEDSEMEETLGNRLTVAISDETYELIAQRIESVFSQSEHVCNPKFDLNELVRLTGSNSRYVSMIINRKYGKNFRMLLNERRVELACQKFDDVEHYGNVTIQSIGYEVGYNSSTNFIEAFKKFKGMTPYKYQKLLIRRSTNKEDI